MLIGIDLRASSNRPSTVATLDGQALVTYLSTFHTDGELLEILEACPPALIAIGAPLGLPDGLCCLEPTCPCEPGDPQKKGRQLELELARMGISCFFTNKRSIIRSLIYRGVNLNSKLAHLGYPVVEVYPYATKVILFGDRLPPNNSASSVTFMRERLPRLVQGLEPYMAGLNRNTCDALVNAYTALLHHRDETDMLGIPGEGLLTLPKLPR